MCDSDDFDMCLMGCYNLRCDRNVITNGFDKFMVSSKGKFDKYDSLGGMIPQGVWTYEFNLYGDHDKFVELMGLITHLYDGVKFTVMILSITSTIVVEIVDYSRNIKPFALINNRYVRTSEGL